jgi:hypothetical protein
MINQKEVVAILYASQVSVADLENKLNSLLGPNVELNDYNRELIKPLANKVNALYFELTETLEEIMGTLQGFNEWIVPKI